MGGGGPGGPWRWPADLDALDALHAALDEVWAAHADVAAADRTALALALSEVLTNAIEHADASWIALAVIVDDERLRAAVTDDGAALPEDVASAFVSEDPMAEGGRGLALAMHFADLGYAREGAGNRWSVVRRRA